jgi:hypothetical protein
MTSVIPDRIPKTCREFVGGFSSFGVEQVTKIMSKLMPSKRCCMKILEIDPTQSPFLKSLRLGSVALHGLINRDRFLQLQTQLGPSVPLRQEAIM